MTKESRRLIIVIKVVSCGADSAHIVTEPVAAGFKYHAFPKALAGDTIVHFQGRPLPAVVVESVSATVVVLRLNLIDHLVSGDGCW